MNDIGENGKFLALLDLMVGPVISELVACFLTGHALLNPLVAAALLLPGFADAVERQCRVSNFPHAFVSHFGKPQLDGLGLRTKDGPGPVATAFWGWQRR